MKFSEDILSPLISDDNKVTGYGLDNQRVPSSGAKSFLFIKTLRPVLGNTKFSNVYWTVHHCNS